METVKSIHIICAVLSFTGFFIRGIWMLMDSQRLNQRMVKIAPHIIDTVLLLSAIIMVVQWRLLPSEQPWLTAKILALVVYIGAGMVALRFGRTKPIRLTAWLFGLITFSYIASVAITKSVAGWLIIF